MRGTEHEFVQVDLVAWCKSVTDLFSSVLIFVFSFHGEKMAASPELVTNGNGQ